MHKTNQRVLPALLCLGLLIFLDQLTKHWAVLLLRTNGPRVLISGVLELRYLENEGAAWGIFAGAGIFFILIALVFIGFAAFFYIRTPQGKKYLPLRIALIFLTAGAAGNLIDRIRTGYVVDFIYISLIDFPIFNVADLFVTFGAAGLLILLLFVYKEEDLKFFHRS